jgi:hypothetical protein
MMGIRLPRLYAVVCLAWGLCSCQGSSPQPSSPRYYGPTLSLDQVVSAIDQNNRKIPTLWTRIVYLEAWFVDRKDKSQKYVNGSGNLLYSAPASIRVSVMKDVVADLLDMGSDGTRFWLWEKHDEVFWWGDYANLEKPGAREIPIRPDLVLEVLGIRPIDPVLTNEPVPVLRFNNDADSYMIVWQKHVADRWAAQKEIWYDRATLRPKTVLLFDPDGRVVLRAWLTDFRPVQIAGVPSEQWPVMATHFKLFFPDTGSRMNFELGDLALTGGSHNAFPKPLSFQMPDLDMIRSRGIKVNQIDDPNGP